MDSSTVFPLGYRADVSSTDLPTTAFNLIIRDPLLTYRNESVYQKNLTVSFKLWFATTITNSHVIKHV